jgi:hypothetical protein
VGMGVEVELLIEVDDALVDAEASLRTRSCLT